MLARLEREGLGPGNGKAVFHELKLDHPTDVKASAEWFVQREGRLDLLSMCCLVTNSARRTHKCDFCFVFGSQQRISVSSLVALSLTRSSGGMNLSALLQYAQEVRNGSCRCARHVDRKVSVSSVASPISTHRPFWQSHISPFAFTHTLLPLLRKTAFLPNADIRIITVSSNAHVSILRTHLPNGFQTRDDLNGPGKKGDDAVFAQARRYCLSKLANILFTRVLGERLDADFKGQVDLQLQGQGDDVGLGEQDGSSRILTMSVHPGAVATEGNYRVNASLPWPFSTLAQLIMRIFFLTPEQGARCVVDAALASRFRENIDEHQGTYLEPTSGWRAPKDVEVCVGLGKLSELAKDDKLAVELWELTERILKEEGIEV